MMKKRESILTKRILAGLMLGLLLGSSFYARPAAAGEVINVVTQEDYEKVKDSNGDVKPQQSLTDNSVTIGTDGGGNSPSIDSSGNRYVYGGYTAGTEAAKNNKVFIKSGTMRDVYGGRSKGAGDVTGNRVLISGGEMDSVFGGYSSNGAATDNKVYISGGTINGSVYGDSSNYGDATKNKVYISGGEMYSVFGGSSNYGDATKNEVYISSGTIEYDVYGGYNYDSAATDNKVYISGGEMDSVYGGYSNNGAATDNKVYIKSGEMYSVYGGYSNNGAATKNEVYISGGTINGSVYGGLGSSDATGNKVYISGTPIFGNNTMLYGGHSDRGGDVSGNVLNIHTKGLQVANVRDFDEYNFYLQNDTKADDTLLTLTGGNDSDKITYITKSKINVGVEGVTPALRIGDSVTLLENTNGIKADNMDYGKEMRQGVSVVYDITTGLNEDGHKLVTTIDGGKVLEQTKSPVETQAAAAAFLNSGADLLAGSGIASMTAATTAEDGAIFGAMGGSSMRYKTGSYADVKGYNLAMGFGKAVTNSAGRLTFGPFIEYGKGEYTSHLDGGIRGDGNTKYYGVGILARQDNNDGVYYEGSLRYGRRDADYASGDLINFADNRVQTSYDSSSAYYGAHLGIGKVNKLNDTTKADVYAKFMYTHQNGDSVALRGEGAGEVYDFDAVDSTRVRVGARVSKAYNNRGTGYAGLAYEYEFDGEAKATVLGFSTPSPSIKGSSGLLELGYILQPKGVNDPAIDINLQGWGGKKQGFTGNVNFVWKF
ncbi:MAG: autotransporter domain-containing protein [Acidaminococcaceae bacterium]|nr:autotransporter domain-containing protein [Acidaminococcaceae bacterium]